MIRKWHVSCAIHTFKALLPFQNQLRYWKDRLIGYEREPAKDSNTIRDGLRLIEWAGDVRGATVLEIGSGQQPMIPILFALAGAGVYTADLYPLFRQETIDAALDALRENHDEIAGRLPVARSGLDHAIRKGGDWRARLREWNVTYLAPCDCRRLPLEAGSVDLVMSRAVLEHMALPLIVEVLRETTRVLGPRGRTLHYIDLADHWAHRDRGITAVNFLQYPEWIWRPTCINPQDFQNRLRLPEYLALFEAAGFAIQRLESKVDQRSLEFLSQAKVAEQFRRFAVEELATTSATLLAERRGLVPA